MTDRRISVVVSRGQSENPKKRALEDDLVAALETDPRFDIYIVPNLYDVQPGGDTVQILRTIVGDMIVFAWSFERASMWVLGRNGIHGHPGEVLLVPDEDEDDEEQEQEEDEGEKQRVADEWRVPDRRIHCVNFQHAADVKELADEAMRIAAEDSSADSADADRLMQWIQGQPNADQLRRYLQPSGNGSAAGNGQGVAAVARIDEQAGRRWYPVIDFSRCTNCMECIDFCLFGVYGVDNAETILVEQPDNCRKGCPACSRVCPENAIIFPQHKTPAIAGAPVVSGALKIDLSKLFGKPDEGDALEVAAKERDEQLMLAGREAVGMSVGIPKRQADKPQQPNDDLDDLLDKLDDMEL